MSNLSINVTNGFLHKSYDIIGKMENYVLFKLTADGRTQQYRTKIVPGKKKEPIVWNETVNMSVPRSASSTARLDVTIMDEDMTKDDVCAKGFINLEHVGMLQPGSSAPYCIRLYGAKKNEVAGELNFTSTYH